MRLLYTALLVALSASPALAQRGPEIVIPGRPGVPVYINGIDASWGIVEGQFGLDRPNEVNPTVVYRPFLASAPYSVPAYYPADGKRPGYGRLEIVPPPNRALPPPAPTYYRYWSSQSAPGPVTQYAPTPPIAISPHIGGYRGHRHPSGSDMNHQANGRKGP
ncbi:MAG: hypothetical protein ACRECV_09245 [Xanthobacteraceae bacterium]